MTSTRPRSNAARFGLLIVALVHFLATAALPFTHTHAPLVGAREILSAPPGTEPGSHQGHTDLCAVCRTLTSAHAGPDFYTAATTPLERVVVDLSYRDAAASPQSFTLSHPRAPPAV